MSWALVESDRITKGAELSDFRQTEIIIPKEYASFFGKEGERLALIYQNREYPAYLETEGGNTKLKWSKVLVRKLGEAFPQYEAWFASGPDEEKTPKFEIVKKNDGFHLRLVTDDQSDESNEAVETGDHSPFLEPQSGLCELLKKWIVGYPNYYPRDFRFSFKDVINEDIPGVIERFEGIKDGNYRVEGFVGDTQWAEIPWVKVRDRRIQNIDGNGLYLAYILAMDSRKIYLVLAYDENGAGVRTLSEKAADFRKCINTEKYQTNHKDVLLANATLVSSIVCYREYTEENMPKDDLLAQEFEDFRKMYALCLEASTVTIEPEEVSEQSKEVETFQENRFEDEAEDVLAEAAKKPAEGHSGSAEAAVNEIEELKTEALPAVETMPKPVEAAVGSQDQKEAGQEKVLSGTGDEIIQKVRESKDDEPLEAEGDALSSDFEAVNVENMAPPVLIDHQEVPQIPSVPLKETKKISLEPEMTRYPAANDHLTPVLQSVQAKMGNRGFFYPAELIKNYYLSIKSKPFVMIKGRIGSGKTTFPRLFAEAVGATAENGRFVRILVGKNWADDTGLFGRQDSRGHFVPGPVMILLKNARDYPEKPHFLLLDEMDQSLAMDYLRTLLDGINGSHETVRSREDFGGDVGAYREFGNLVFPDNLYVIGTINEAPGSYPLEPKIMDSGNIIEMPVVEIGAFPNYGNVTNDTEWENSQFKIQNKVQGLPEILEKLMYRLNELQEILKKYYCPMGYRGKNEILAYGINSGAEGLFTEDEVIDIAIRQRILPALADADEPTKRILKELGLFSLKEDLKEQLLNENADETFAELYKKLLDEALIPCHRTGRELLIRLKRI